MKDHKKYSNKTKAAFILLIVMLIILLGNFNTLRNSKNVNDNINAIYKDRLVVAHYIFQYSKQLHFIKSEAEKLDLSDNIKKNEIIHTLDIIHNIDDLYAKTVLTNNEKKHFDAFLGSCKEINKQAENKNWNKIAYSSAQALKTLESLSQIQIKEGKAKLANANAMYSKNNSLGQLQIALLIILGGITFYLLIVKKIKRKIKIPEPPSMN
ncbi:Four helix bundle sensory module for signal transduction [Flavobacterium sp. CF108]|uniref:MCP four helix bundle domain-containing protein n=1 Tax=unclassified Flavobacterium TaxID=196869 RepID=UPI0008AB1EFF|nr:MULTISPECIES: MCP four helix bundle domain-containing protein [unclassified Flavobacterium]SEO28819.1 Four helix bundle sensory module for signal transduction [Flavobacterium sp. fv08]SHG44058.1 Four helix bundle sensory module for signal transduction [Flavobacterium sp. CF108]